ncbi:MAG: alpha/beta hydrolase [Rhizobiaceae bacterium]
MSYPAKYRQLLDGETWAFIERTESFYPPNAVDLSIEEQRKVYDRLCAAFATPYPVGVQATDFSIATNGRPLPCRHYTDKQRLTDPVAHVLYFHGGGFVVGGLHSHDSYCADICRATGFDITAVDYRLAPEHAFPADHEDAARALQHVAAHCDLPVILLGDSAGANLAAALAHATRWNQEAAIGQVLVYPLLGSDWARGSYVDHAKAPMLTTEDVKYYSKIRLAGTNAHLTDKELAPLNDTDFTGLPSTIVFAAQCDPLRDDGWLYVKQVKAAGSDAVFVEEKGLVHSFLMARHSVGRAAAAVRRIGRAILALGHGSDISDPANLSS